MCKIDMNVYYGIEDRMVVLKAKTKKFDTVESLHAKKHLVKRLGAEQLRIVCLTHAGMEIE